MGLVKSFKRGSSPLPAFTGYASLGVSSGASSRIVGEVLGHREVRTTDRYAGTHRIRCSLRFMHYHFVLAGSAHASPACAP